MKRDPSTVAARTRGSDARPAPASLPSASPGPETRVTAAPTQAPKAPGADAPGSKTPGTQAPRAKAQGSQAPEAQGTQAPRAKAQGAEASPSTVPHFVFCTCQVGAEPTLKAEVLEANPSLRFAFSRPGFVTFKQEGDALTERFRLVSRLGVPGRTKPRSKAKEAAAGEEALIERGSADGPLAPPVFARSFGFSLGRVETVPQILALARALKPASQSLRLHVFPRDRFRPDEVPPQVDEYAESVALEKALREQVGDTPDLFYPETLAQLGDRVLELVVAPGESTWIGFHTHSSHHSPYPGGRTVLQEPPAMPSRAWRKLEEARQRFDIPFRQGDQAVEVGSAPGGAAYRLLSLGVKVVGIDPDAMDPMVLQYGGPSGARLKHIQKPVSEVRREALPHRIDWLLLDANLAPQTALHAVHRLADLMRGSLLGVIFTLKLNQWSLAAQLPDFLRRIAAMGVVHPRVMQLSSNRQEVCVYGLTALGQDRHQDPY